MGKRELVALLSLSSWCLVIVVWLFLAVPLVFLQFVIVVFPDNIHTYNFLLEHFPNIVHLIISHQNVFLKEANVFIFLILEIFHLEKEKHIINATFCILSHYKCETLYLVITCI